jgi:UDP-glucose 4-epimerase
VGKVFNVGGDSVVSLDELARLLVEANGGGVFDRRAFPAERKRIDIGDYYADDTLLRATLGWAPRTSLPAGLKQTLDWYRTHLSHYL